MVYVFLDAIFVVRSVRTIMQIALTYDSLIRVTIVHVWAFRGYRGTINDTTQKK
jgi:hypothetical protein